MMNALFPYALTTGSVTVRVSVSFQADNSDPSASRWFWTYHIRIENRGEDDIQLISRRWEITDSRGTLNVVEGLGVVGEQPVIAPGAAFDYVSGCPLNTPSGRMVGSYGMVDGSGRQFRIGVPDIPLLGPAVSR